MSLGSKQADEQTTILFCWETGFYATQFTSETSEARARGKKVQSDTQTSTTNQSSGVNEC
jgi:hypothetical protein